MPRQGDRRHSPRVRLYQRIVAAIDDGTFPPGARLPPEPELAGRLGVSRSALREVLILLQEDGVITRRQGSGSTVNQRPPAPGLERLLPVEELLGPGAVRCHRRAVELEEPTDFSGHHLRMAPAERSRFWETVVEVDGAPACFAHEWAADESVLRTVAGPALIEALAAPGAGEVTEEGSVAAGTMLAVFLEAAPGLAFTARSTLGATVLGEERGRAVSRAPETPALLLTQTVSASGRPLLSAKYLFPGGAPPLALTPRR
ncbi:GntR family transcriptional regulator [Streptomyces iconiensis]|uniref:GntR family transcriptional regulator n=1 Tax=Streptomyces iconiensis TaxID=1384038 RepID=A0ABT6ZU31_9ACTN|nr:GntR family transcriptional regulator [Streptomyces iconiensis]MDJ1132146.1 GntR family transcriptional regulator [Streptomyces iconiensis]